MYRTESGLRLSATDLAHFLSCRHLTALELAAVRQDRERPRRKEDPLFDLMVKRGMEHEAAYVERLESEGRKVERITKDMRPCIPVIPTMSTGATDRLKLRNAGIPVYGVSGFFYPETYAH